MKPTTILNVALLFGSSSGAVLPSSPSQLSTTALSKRDNCGTGELKVYSNNNNFLCVGTTVFWTGVAITAIYAPIIAASSTQFGTWVTNKITGSPSLTETAKRDDVLDIWDEDEESITYGWKPAHLMMRDVNGTIAGDFSWIHNMTKSYNKITGNLTQATMVFDGEHDSLASLNGTNTIGKRDTTPITITYYAVKGHQETSLGYQDVVNLYTQAFFSAPGGAGSECGYAANSGSWHGAFKITVSGCNDAGTCYNERQF